MEVNEEDEEEEEGGKEVKAEADGGKSKGKISKAAFETVSQAEGMPEVSQALTQSHDPVKNQQSASPSLSKIKKNRRQALTIDPTAPFTRGRIILPMTDFYYKIHEATFHQGQPGTPPSNSSLLSSDVFFKVNAHHIPLTIDSNMDRDAILTLSELKDYEYPPFLCVQHSSPACYYASA